LLLGVGGRRGFDVACLMGETSGYVVDPMSARAVLEVLESLLDFDVSYDALDDRAEEMEEVLGRLKEMEEGPSPGGEDDLRYIG
ncbi:MAG: PAC2 family protein, partial [Halanaeroarchaeum sp.]